MFLLKDILICLPDIILIGKNKKLAFFYGDNTLALKHGKWPNYVLSDDISTAAFNIKCAFL